MDIVRQHDLEDRQEVARRNNAAQDEARETLAERRARRDGCERGKLAPATE